LVIVHWKKFGLKVDFFAQAFHSTLILISHNCNNLFI
jgi:hypothetical protein